MGAAAVQPVQKERVRGPYLRVLVPRSQGVPFERALVLAEGANGVIASNKRLDKALVGSDEWQRVKEVFAAWSGTMTAYKEPGQKLGKQIEYVDSETDFRWVFSVPEAHKDKKSAIEKKGSKTLTKKVKGKLTKGVKVKNKFKKK